MNNLTKIAALPTGGGCQSALRPEDRGAERKEAPNHEMLNVTKTWVNDKLVWEKPEPSAPKPLANGESVQVVLTSHSIGEVTHATMSAGLARKIVFFKGGGA